MKRISKSPVIKCLFNSMWQAKMARKWKRTRRGAALPKFTFWYVCLFDWCENQRVSILSQGASVSNLMKRCQSIRECAWYYIWTDRQTNRQTNILAKMQIWASNEFFHPYLQIKPVWPSNAIWRQIFGLPLAQAMAWCLAAPSHYLNEYKIIIKGVLWHSPWSYCMDKLLVSITTTSPSDQCVNSKEGQ